MTHGRLGPRAAPRLLRYSIALLLLCATTAHAQQPSAEPVVHRVGGSNERLEMTVNGSRMLSLDTKIPRAQVNNREILDLTPLSPTEVQLFAKKPGVTQVNLWTEDGRIHTVDVIVYGDARELDMLLKSQFPHSSIKVTPLANSVVLSGYVERNDHVSQVIRMAEDYYPKVIPNIEVGGVQQILLHVKVMEVSRTGLRALGVDFAAINGGDFVVSSVSGLINATAASVGTATGSGDTVRFGFVDGNDQFFGFIEALRRNQVGKVLAEPTLVTVSGRPAFFRVGGEFPILVPQSLGVVSIEYKQFGTRVDFVPIVLGNGNIRLEVRPQLSEIDETRSVTVSGMTIPGIRTREVDTGVEMRAGQTLALAGLVQERVDVDSRGLPILADLPYFGVPFRRNREIKNEIELLILVTPELVEGIEAHEVPPCGPGMASTSPNDHEFYLKGHLEVPSCGPCGPNQAQGCAPGAAMQGGEMIVTPPTSGAIYEEVPPMPSGAQRPIDPATQERGAPSAGRNLGPSYGRQTSMPVRRRQAVVPQTSTADPRYNRNSPSDAPSSTSNAARSSEAGLIGPVGYDVFK